jgi:hypothetical protein
LARNHILGAILFDDELLAREFLYRKVNQTEATAAQDFLNGVSVKHETLL